MEIVHPATASVATDSAASSSTGPLTPGSDSTINFFSGPTDGTPFQFHGQSGGSTSAGPLAHELTPSIEEDTDIPSDDNYTSSAPGAHPRGPGIVVQREERGVDSLAAVMANTRLSSPASNLGMSDMAAALDGVATGSDYPASRLSPEYQGIGGQPSNQASSRRRRSSSRISIPSHDVRDEEPPHNGFHEPIFQQAFGDAKMLMVELVDVLGSSSLHNDADSTMRRLYKQTTDLAHFQCPSSRIVGFVGDSGVGKSSLLNSLLDFRGLARTSNSGAACTCVVTEYHYHDSDKFAVETELLSLDAIMEQVTELLGSYRKYHSVLADIERGENVELEDKRDLEERATIAQDTFRAMFRGRLDSEQFLTSEPEDSVLVTLRSWAQAMIPSVINGREVRFTLAECSALLIRLTSEQTSGQDPVVWPYVRKIKVFLKAHILSKGLVLVDLPGLRDLNSARRNITERYLLQCNEIFAICNIGRATTDAGVEDVIKIAGRAKLSSVGIICTRSEDIQPEEAKKDWKGQKAKDVQRLIDAVATDDQDLQDIETKLEDIDDLTEDEKEDEQRLYRRSREVRKQKDNHIFELKKYLVKTRNTSVRGKLEEFNRHKVPGGGLRVFCVSNTDYWEHRDLPKDIALPFLELSEIIAVRKHCISMVANTQLCIATKYIRDDIPATLSDITLWVESGAGTLSAERKNAIRETINVLETRLRRDLTENSSQVNGIARLIREEFQAEVYERRRISDWRQTAINASIGWSMWNHSTYRAFCLNYGDHYTKAVQSHNWNEEAIDRMVRDLAIPWQSFRSTVQDLQNGTTRLIDESIEKAIQYLDTELEEFADSTATLSQALTSRQRLLTTDVEEVCVKFDDSISILGTDALSGIRTSLIGRAMESSYRHCNLESGAGSDKRRKRVINDTLSRERLFEELMKQFRKNLNDLADGLQNDIAAAVETHLNVVRGTLDIVRSEHVASESEQDPEFRCRVGAGIEAAKENLQRILTVVPP